MTWSSLTVCERSHTKIGSLHAGGGRAQNQFSTWTCFFEYSQASPSCTFSRSHREVVTDMTFIFLVLFFSRPTSHRDPLPFLLSKQQSPIDLALNQVSFFEMEDCTFCSFVLFCFLVKMLTTLSSFFVCRFFVDGA